MRVVFIDTSDYLIREIIPSRSGRMGERDALKKRCVLIALWLRLGLMIDFGSARCSFRLSKEKSLPLTFALPQRSSLVFNTCVSPDCGSSSVKGRRRRRRTSAPLLSGSNTRRSVDVVSVQRSIGSSRRPMLRTERKRKFRSFVVISIQP